MNGDRSKQKGDFEITGSQVFRLMKNVSESLADRVGIINLLGLSDAEIYQDPSEPFHTDAEYSKVLYRNFMQMKILIGKPIIVPMQIPIYNGIFEILHKLRMKCSFIIL